MSETKKRWQVRTINDKTNVEFFPVFEAKQAEDGKTVHDIASYDGKDVECTRIEVTVKDKKGKDRTLIFNFLDLYMFIYFVASEELRQNLQQRYEREVNYIPYDVTFRIDKEEAQKGVAKRRIELPVDELTMAIARNEAWKVKLQSKV